MTGSPLCPCHGIGDSLRSGVELIIDLSRVEFIDVVGMSAIVGAVRRVRAVGGHVEICGASPEVRRRLELARVDRFVMRSSETTGNDYA